MKWEAGLFILGVIFVTLALFSWGRTRQKNSGTKVTAREHIDRVRQKQAVRDDMNELMVEIEQMAKRLGAQLDAKTIHIEKATREAEERIAQLEALRSTAPLGDAPAPPAPPALPLATAGPGVAENPPLPSPMLVHESGSTDVAQAPLDEPDTDPLMGRVYALADAGKGPQAIAQELQEQVGKVELILALRSA